MIYGMEINIDDQYILKESSSYKVEQSDSLGRCLVATKDIKKGEIILTDFPLVTGPIKESEVLCPGCYQPPETNCKQCGWPVCGSKCPSFASHDQAECTFLSRKAEEWKSFHLDRDWHTFSDSLMILRCLLFKQNDDRKWRQIMAMETNWEQWSQSPLYFSAKRIEEFLRNKYGLTNEEFSTKDILTVQAILDINAFEVRLPEVNIQAIYKKASLAEHNCLPNTHRTICSETLELTLRAATDIPQGCHIKTTYCDILWPTWHRQQFLQWSKFFICSCERCLSVTECDSHLASLVCMHCYLNQIDSETRVPAATPIISGEKTWEIINKDYQCSACNLKIPARECQIISKNADDALSELDKYASLETISTYENWLNKWTLVNHIIPGSCLPASEKNDKAHMGDDDNNVDSDIIHKEEETKESLTSKRRKTETCYSKPQLLLHPNHSLVLDACHTLFLLYPRENCSLAHLKRKESFGAHILKATKPLTGISKFRGTTSYELAMTKAAILVQHLEESGLTDNLQLLAQEVLQLLGDSQELLKYEPADQPEGKLAQTGANQLEQLTLFFSELFPQTTTFRMSS